MVIRKRIRSQEVVLKDYFLREGIILYRVPEFLSSRLNWVPAPPPPEASVPPPHLGPCVGQNDRQNYRSLFSGGIMMMQG